MICTCTRCGELLRQDRKPEGLNYCTNCGSIFLVPAKRRVPPWILGVVAFLIANWQILRTV
jgi:DNA-directed RNA polymerase subunit RPC12/RpoP